MKNKTNWRRKAADSRTGIGRYPSEGFGYDRYGYTEIRGQERKEESVTPLPENKSSRRTPRSGVIGQRKSTKTRSRSRI